MDKVSVSGIRINSNHGCLDEEALIGSEYEVDIVVWGDVSASFQSDDLRDTMDYVKINEIAEKHVSQRMKLIEAVSYKILNEIFEEMPKVMRCQVKLSKINPPINGDVERVSFEVLRDRHIQ